MIKRIILLIILIESCMIGKGQEKDNRCKRIVDSLDLIRPAVIPGKNVFGCPFMIKIRNQQQFDNINQSITDAIRNGHNNIIVKIRKGVYHFHEYHVLRKDDNAENVSIAIEGNNAVITSDTDYGLITSEPWSELVEADDTINILDWSQKLCRIPYKNKRDVLSRGNFTKVQITEWFKSVIYDIQHIDDQGISFIAPDLQYDGQLPRKGYNVNYDYLYKGKYPRFRLYDETKSHNCEASRFFVLINSTYKNVTISGLTFKSNKTGGALLSASDVKADRITITNCTFDAIRGNVAHFGNTNNVIFEKNVVCNTDGNELLFSRGCSNVYVTNNKFEKCGNSLKQTFCVNCGEAEYYIAYNTFVDFGYAAIGVGVWHGHIKNNLSRGIIEYNEMYYSPSYLANKGKYTLMDSGAIYTWTQNDDVIIRYNYIHDYEGMGDNRGIFCDDGANNLKIYGNVILKTPNCYSIDSRMAKDKREGFTNNANNFMANNVVDNGVRFQGHADVQRHVVKGANLVVKSGSKDAIKDIFDNLEHIEEDMVITNAKSRIIRKQIRKCTHR